MNRSLSATSLLAIALLLGAPISRAAGTPAHRPGLRDQWQPQTEHDARLAQPVRIEILGRAAVPALKMLSKETGVTLQVAPENLDSVGERKLTVIAQGCSLKSLLVQLPKALQECHWDIDVTGPQPVYLLHRNGSMEDTIANLVTAEKAAGRSAREARLDAARQAMAMSPEELAEVARADPMLAAAVKDPVTRQYLEVVFALPDAAREQLVTTGSTAVDYATASVPVQQHIAAWLRSECTRESGGDARTLAEMESFIASLPEMVVSFEQAPDGEIASMIWDPRTSSVSGSGPGFPQRLSSDSRYRPILLGAGMTAQDADALLADLGRQREQRETAARDRRHAEWREPRSEGLRHEVMLPFTGDVNPAEVERFIAQETGLSVVSDYFTPWIPQPIPPEAEAPMPAWRLLYVLGEAGFWAYDWDEVGDCLVFHDRAWYRQVLCELPESMEVMLRDALEQHMRLTLDDLAAVAANLQASRPLPERLRALEEWPLSLPPDLTEAGVWPYLRSGVLLLYDSLSPEQKAQARRPEGLPYAEMTPAQRALVPQYRFTTGGGHATLRYLIPPEEVSQGAYHIETVGEAGSEQERPVIRFPSVDVWE
jgi:hypothetical protein